MLGRGLKHIVGELDPHSHYLTAAERDALKARARGGVTGLSTVLERRQGGGRRLRVLGVESGSAADEAGIAPGDHVLSVRGRDVDHLIGQADAEALLLGSVGERLELTVQRRASAHPQDLALELRSAGRAEVHGQLVAVDGGKVACVHIPRFGPNTGNQTKASLASLRRKAGASKIRGVILDLRGNPGGEVDQALVVADLFVRKGLLTRTRGRDGKVLREETAHPRGTDDKTPLAVLIDRHSASAAELLAAALQDLGRAVVVGERSYGKGTVQRVKGLEDGSVLTLTIARYVSLDGRVIDGVGVEPNIVAPASSTPKLVAAALKGLALNPRPPSADRPGTR